MEFEIKNTIPFMLKSLGINLTKYVQDLYEENYRDFPGGAVVKNLPLNAGDPGSSPGVERPHLLQSN